MRKKDNVKEESILTSKDIALKYLGLYILDTIFAYTVLEYDVVGYLRSSIANDVLSNIVSFVVIISIPLICVIIALHYFFKYYLPKR